MTEVLNIDYIYKNNKISKRIEILIILYDKLNEICKYNLCNEIVTNASVGSVLQDLSYYTTTNPFNVSLVKTPKEYCIGNIKDIKIYVDSYMKFTTLYVTYFYFNILFYI